MPSCYGDVSGIWCGGCLLPATAVALSADGLVLAHPWTVLLGWLEWFSPVDGVPSHFTCVFPVLAGLPLCDSHQVRITFWLGRFKKNCFTLFMRIAESRPNRSKNSSIRISILQHPMKRILWIHQLRYWIHYNVFVCLSSF